jgi:hypothetical protein
LWVYYIWAARSQADSPRRVRVSGDPPQSRHRSKRLHRPIGMTAPPATSAIVLIMPATKSGVMSARQQPMHETPQRMPDTIPVVSRARSRFRKRGPGVLPAGARSAASYRPSVRTIIASRWGRCCPPQQSVLIPPRATAGWEAGDWSTVAAIRLAPARHAAAAPKAIW